MDYKIAICDDEQNQIKYLSGLVKSWAVWVYSAHHGVSRLYCAGIRGGSAALSDEARLGGKTQ